MTDISKEAVDRMLDGVTAGRAVQFHPTYCPEAKDAPVHEWDTSHQVSVIRSDGSRYRIAEFRHASDAAFYCAARELVPALSARLAEVERERDDLRKCLHKMHRRAQASEGKAARSAAILNQIIGRIASIIPTLPKLPDTSGAPLHQIYHHLIAARDHARAGSGRAALISWFAYGALWRKELSRAEAAEAAHAATKAALDEAVDENGPISRILQAN